MPELNIILFQADLLIQKTENFQIQKHGRISQH